MIRPAVYSIPVVLRLAAFPGYHRPQLGSAQRKELYCSWPVQKDVQHVALQVLLVVVRRHVHLLLVPQLSL